MELAGFDAPPILDMTSVSNSDLVPINEHDFQNKIYLTENYYYEHASGDKWLLSISLFDAQTEVCNSIPYPWGNLATTSIIDGPVFAQLPSSYDGGYALYDPHTRLLEKKPKIRPLMVVIQTKLISTNSLCSNVPQTFQNEEQCQLYTNPSACHNQKSDFVPNGVGTVVCGSPGEVLNDPTLGAGFTFRN